MRERTGIDCRSRLKRRVLENFLGCFIDLEIKGQLPGKGPLIVVFNHNSTKVRYPIFGLVALCSKWPVNKVAFLRHPPGVYGSFPGFLLSSLEILGATGIPTTHGGMRNATEHLEDGNILLMAPEGKGNEEGRLTPGRNGAAWLARVTKAPILPVGIEYDPSCRDLDILTGRLGVGVNIGMPFGLEFSGRDKEQLREATERIMLEIASLLPDSRK